MGLTEGAYERPQDFGFAAFFFLGMSTVETVLNLYNEIVAAKMAGAKGAWVGLQSSGGVPGAGPYLRDLIATLEFPVIGHVHDVFSEGASVVAAFPHRSIAPVGAVGFHQASMSLNAGSYQEARLSDLLQQVHGHNRRMEIHLSESFGIERSTVNQWVHDGKVLIGPAAVDAGVVHRVARPVLTRPEERKIVGQA